ncbi:MAG: hypothetical protein HOP95_07660 [Sphingomonas sp.]|nr:hypothetical protein [Sphingomonas sp.]
MSAPLKIYRIYSYDVGRKIVTADFIKAADDAGAIATAEAADFAGKRELWDGRRMVAQIDGERRQA